MKKEKSELEIELEQTIDFLKKRMSEYEFEYSKKLGEIKFLEEENKKLKSDLSECECSMHFENDEVGYRKRECKKLKEDVDYFRQCYLDLKKLCEKEGFMLSDDEVTKMFNLDKKD